MMANKCKNRTKAVSPVISVVLIVAITVAVAAGVYTWVTSTTAEATKVSSEAKAISSCMRIQYANGNKVYLINCGKGVIDRESLAVYVNGAKMEFNMNPTSIGENETAEISIKGLGELSPSEEHSLKITNGKITDEKYFRLKYGFEHLVRHPSAVLAFTFDVRTIEGSTVRDLSGNGNDGIIHGAKSVPGRYGDALQFDGIDDYVSVPDSESLDTNSLTVLLWFKLNENPNCGQGNNWRSFLRKGATSVTQTGWDIVLEMSGIFTYDLNGTRFRPPNISTMPLNEWAFYMFTYDAETGKMKVYKGTAEGIQMGEKTRAPGAIIHNDYSLLISGGVVTGCPPGGKGFVPGVYDQLMIFNEALSPDEIYTIKLVGS